MNSYLKNVLEEVSFSSLIDWNKINNKTIFITGATGYIGSMITKSLIYKMELDKNFNVNLILLVRDYDKAKAIFGENLNIQYTISDVQNYVPKELNIDYIIHAASPTKSKYFISSPIETLNIAINGTNNVLLQGKKSNVKSMVYLSSMEAYGVINQKVDENDLGYIDNLNIRSSYSEGKRACELYCKCYFEEYNVPVKIARLAQTFGPGISENETRVYKYFANSILNNNDIILKTDGKTIVNYCYISDAIIGILKILLDGSNGEAYNVVSDNSNLRVIDIANWLISEFGEKNQCVKIEKEKGQSEFAPDNSMILLNYKLKSIGWYPKYNLKEGYTKLLNYLKEETKK